MGDYRSFQVTLISASNLLDVRIFGEMKVYAKVSMSRNPSKTKWKTPVDMRNMTNPRWNCQIQYIIPEETLRQVGNGDMLLVKLWCKRFILPNKYVGEVSIPLNRLFAEARACENVVYDVLRNDAEGTYGTLNLSYRFGEVSRNIDVPVLSQSNTPRDPPGPRQSNTTRGYGLGRPQNFVIVLGAIADGVQIWNSLFPNAEELYQMVYGG
ncbi:hypothetical protein ACH5RR_027035 [Cinchona calisaya]|uniref:C2 domain-containing protein n=1 Tax=Cinchona calisaya TaxID=153742 RepID=A0ABD2Z4B5_9GENT